MKKLLVITAILVAGYYGWQQYSPGSKPRSALPSIGTKPSNPRVADYRKKVAAAEGKELARIDRESTTRGGLRIGRGGSKKGSLGKSSRPKARSGVERRSKLKKRGSGLKSKLGLSSKSGRGGKGLKTGGPKSRLSKSGKKTLARNKNKPSSKTSSSTRGSSRNSIRDNSYSPVVDSPTRDLYAPVGGNVAAGTVGDDADSGEGKEKSKYSGPGMVVPPVGGGGSSYSSSRGSSGGLGGSTGGRSRNTSNNNDDKRIATRTTNNGTRNNSPQAPNGRQLDPKKAQQVADSRAGAQQGAQGRQRVEPIWEEEDEDLALDTIIAVLAEPATLEVQPLARSGAPTESEPVTMDSMTFSAVNFLYNPEVPDPDGDSELFNERAQKLFEAIDRELEEEFEWDPRYKAAFNNEPPAESGNDRDARSGGTTPSERRATPPNAAQRQQGHQIIHNTFGNVWPGQVREALDRIEEFKDENGGEITRDDLDDIRHQMKMDGFPLLDAEVAQFIVRVMKNDRPMGPEAETQQQKPTEKRMKAPSVQTSVRQAKPKSFLDRLKAILPSSS